MLWLYYEELNKRTDMKRSNSSANRLAPIDRPFILIKLYFSDLVTSLTIKTLE